MWCIYRGKNPPTTSQTHPTISQPEPSSVHYIGSSISPIPPLHCFGGKSKILRKCKNSGLPRPQNFNIPEILPTTGMHESQNFRMPLNRPGRARARVQSFRHERHGFGGRVGACRTAPPRPAAWCHGFASTLAPHEWTAGAAGCRRAGRDRRATGHLSRYPLQ